MSSQCTDHADVAADRSCAECRRVFCDACLERWAGKLLCPHCLKDRQAGGREAKPNYSALIALVMAITSFFITTPLFAFMAIVIAAKKINDIKYDREPNGLGLARTAMWLGIISMAIWVIGLLFVIITRQPPSA